jgi:hypothetical protein
MSLSVNELIEWSDDFELGGLSSDPRSRRAELHRVHSVFLPPVVKEAECEVGRFTYTPPVRRRAHHSVLLKMFIFLSLGSRDYGFESHSGHGCLICVCVFFLCLCCPVSR